MRKLLPFLLTLALAWPVAAYNFSYELPSGQTIYLTFNGTNSVKVVAPAVVGWNGFSMPSGRMEIPSVIVHEGNAYSVTAIESMAFEGCKQLTAVSIPGSVTTVGMRAFADDSLLTSALLAEGVQRIDMMAFFHCAALDTVALPTTLRRVAAAAFEGCGYYNNPDNWNNQLSLLMGQWLIKEGNLASGTVRVPEGVVGLANNAFIYCDDVTLVDLPSTLRYVGEGVFKECYGLDTVRLRCDVPPAVYDDSFEGVNPLPLLMVPCSTLTAYTNASYWSLHSIEETPCPDYPYPLPPIPIPQLSVDETALSVPTVAVVDGGVEVRDAEGLELTVVDAVGRRVASVARAAAAERLPLPASGLYVLRTSTGAAVKISYFR